MTPDNLVLSKTPWKIPLVMVRFENLPGPSRLSMKRRADAVGESLSGYGVKGGEKICRDSR